MSHTPGPWGFWKEMRKGYSHGVSSDAKKCDVADVLDLEGNPEESEANARLVAAAPDLLRACKRSLHLVEENNEEIVKMVGAFGLLTELQAAIAKAEGK